MLNVKTAKSDLAKKVLLLIFLATISTLLWHWLIESGISEVIIVTVFWLVMLRVILPIPYGLIVTFLLAWLSLYKSKLFYIVFILLSGLLINTDPLSSKLIIQLQGY